MTTILNKMQYLSKVMKTKPIDSWKQHNFHKNTCLFDGPTFSEKPPWLKKFKLKQASFQKDDGRPTFLKKGVPDQILYNLTLFGLIGGLFWSWKVIVDLDKPQSEAEAETEED